MDQVFAGKDLLIERNGKDIAVMIPEKDYLAIRETLEEMRDAREAAEAYKEWQKNPDVTRAWDEVDAELDEG